MRKVGLHRLYKWRPSAKFTCLGVAVFCGILTACPVVAILEGQPWREPIHSDPHAGECRLARVYAG